MAQKVAAIGCFAIGADPEKVAFQPAARHGPRRRVRRQRVIEGHQDVVAFTERQQPALAIERDAVNPAPGPAVQRPDDPAGSKIDHGNGTSAIAMVGGCAQPVVTDEGKYLIGGYHEFVRVAGQVDTVEALGRPPVVEAQAVTALFDDNQRAGICFAHRPGSPLVRTSMA